MASRLPIPIPLFLMSRWTEKPRASPSVCAQTSKKIRQKGEERVVANEGRRVPRLRSAIDVISEKGLEELDNNASKIGLQINENKTKYMIISPNESKRRPRNIDIGGKTFEGLSHFKHLGTILDNDNSNHREVCESSCDGAHVAPYPSPTPPPPLKHLACSSNNK
ncbi:hypothetical protein CEXT_740371 [Caerostris extrusa]|uniref:Uncharacterized protein n=1 Tax=Caerostris extrusa TaxID=172846 RepID=A0AAV4MHH6_CAEEX|nr:hypothetical protein CEXT_740371 [Caerostris extrusa]